MGWLWPRCLWGVPGEGVLWVPQAAAAVGATLSELAAAMLGAGWLAALASRAEDRATDKVPSTFRTGVVGVKGLLIASSAVTCKYNRSSLACILRCAQEEVLGVKSEGLIAWALPAHLAPQNLQARGHCT